jgi:hypothetical protein
MTRPDNLRYGSTGPSFCLAAGRALTYRSKRTSNGKEVDQGIARKAQQEPEGEMEGTETAAAAEAR